MTAMNDTICQGQNTTLGKTGGILGTMGIWKWYTGTCGGTFSGTGNTITVNPVVTTDYYLRAEGICNTTQCVNLTVTVNDTSVSSTGITSSETVICEGTTITMNENGGMPGTAANWQWYSGTCGGAPEGNGTTLTVTPLQTKYYYVRAEGECNTTPCVNIQITVNDSTELATGLTATMGTICESQSTVLGMTGGALGTGADWYWYKGQCGTMIAGQGINITVSPTVTTTYYMRGEGICNTTNCLNITITVNDSSVMAMGIVTTQDTLCPGQSTTLGITGGTLGTSAGWHWYQGQCGGSAISSGLTITVSPATTAVYYLRAEGICNTTQCINKIITVKTNSILPAALTTTQGTIINGTSTQLGMTGEITGTGGTWNWYTVSCGGTAAGNGTTITVSPISNYRILLKRRGRLPDDKLHDNNDNCGRQFAYRDDNGDERHDLQW